MHASFLSVRARAHWPITTLKGFIVVVIIVVVVVVVAIVDELKGYL